MSTVTLITIAKIWKPPKCQSTDEWVKKVWHGIHTMEYVSVLLKKEIMPFATAWRKYFCRHFTEGEAEVGEIIFTGPHN